MTELAPPNKSHELEDPGAHELEQSENDSDVFADAQEGQQSVSGSSSPVPITRVERVDERANHGEVPGTEAYNMRTQDAVPDEVEIVPEGENSRRGSRMSPEPESESARGTPVPRTVVEKLDTDAPSHGQIPGTTAYRTHKADAVPDEIHKSPTSAADSSSEPRSASSQEVHVPRTVITRVDSKPAHGEVPGTEAYDIRKGDAEPDVLERKSDIPDLPTSSLNRSTRLAFGARRPSLEGASPIAADGGFGPMTYDEDEDGAEKEDEPDAHEEPEEDDGFGDDFDDFEAGAGDEDFGDFDDGFEQPSELAENQQPAPPKPSLPVPESPFSLPSFPTITDLPTLLSSITSHLDTLFPTTTNPLPPPTPKPSPQTPSPIFPTPRAASLWTQLVAPPPLQPPNWVRSRIRRLFLVSLGVPIDLDEILPASKQKKLILPSTIRTSSRGPRGKLENSSSTALDQHSKAVAGGRKKKGPPPEPKLDLGELRRLCATTEKKLEGMTEEELRGHVTSLEGMEGRARELRVWWERRREEKVGDKEAFEGVIANLVRHAKRLRR